MVARRGERRPRPPNAPFALILPPLRERRLAAGGTHHHQVRIRRPAGHPPTAWLVNALSTVLTVCRKTNKKEQKQVMPVGSSCSATYARPDEAERIRCHAFVSLRCWHDGWLDLDCSCNPPRSVLAGNTHDTYARDMENHFFLFYRFWTASLRYERGCRLLGAHKTASCIFGPLETGKQGNDTPTLFWPLSAAYPLGSRSRGPLGTLGTGG